MSRTNNERFMLLGGEQIPHEYAITKSNQITFTKTEKKGISIHVRMTNMVAWSYLTKMGGTKVTINKEIWDSLLLHNIAINAEYIPRVLNVEAGR